VEDLSPTTGDEAYEAWRAARHASMPTTDRRRLDDAVRRATGETAVEWRRIVGGETNEVYVASLPSGDELIVRASRQGAACRFESEQWAVSAAAAAGVPVPTILLIERTTDEEGELALCVERRLPGHGISEIDDPVERRRLTALAGEAAAQLHTIEMSGCGWVRPDGTAPAPSWERVMHLGATPEALDALCAQAIEHEISPVWVRAAADELDRHDELLAPLTPRLLHGDLSPNHVLTDGERITGLLDFEQVFAGDRAFELVRWDYFYRMAPVEWLLEGYERVADLGPEATLRIRLGRLRLHLAVIDFYSRMGHTLALAVVRTRFEEDAEWFGFPS
jgi:hygromycin-B 4-O-kinase